MSVKIQVNIFGQPCTISALEGEEEYYREIASNLDKKFHEWVSKNNMRNLMKTAAQVAFMLALENDKYKKQHEDIKSIESKLDECLEKINIR